MSADKPHPAHLEPSELGTKEYWDEYYQNDLDHENGVWSGDEDGDGQDAKAGDGDDDDDDDDDEPESSSHQPPDPSELDSWFDDVGAPAKTLAFLTSTTFPLSPNYIAPAAEGTTTTNTRTTQRDNSGDHPPALPPSVLDLGTGNGSALFALRLHGHYSGRMVGVDYSTKSVELARKLRAQYAAAATATASSSPSGSSSSASSVMDNIDIHVLDIIHDAPASQPWWPSSQGGFDLVLDKGTFDAISLSSATVSDPDPALSGSSRPARRRICELYPAKVLAMVAPGGFLLVTSCNWTEAEVVAWFTSAAGAGEDGSDSPAPENGEETTGISEKGGRGGERAVFEVHATIKYPVFEFGGQKGQGVASVCFQKKLQRGSTDQR